MIGDTHMSSNENEPKERRLGPPDRRIGTPDARVDNDEHRIGLSNRRMATYDKNITIVTGHGEYKGTINLNSASVRVDSVGDYFTKSDIAFITAYNAILAGQPGKVALVNIKDAAMIIPHEDMPLPALEVRHDVNVMVKLRFGIGQIAGKTNLLGETRPVDRISDLLNYPGKKWLIVYETSFRGRSIPAAIINFDFISSVEG
ncbi:MAG: hypothetical protein JRH15_12500 [Deltaproteobacteria bacterium]|nr:hypothetical protein [Deltaproteobacteria bacterium]